MPDIITDMTTSYDVDDFDLLYDDDDYDQADIPDINTENLLTPEDALYTSINQLGRVSLEYMAKLTVKTEDELINILGGRYIWQDPEEYDRHKDPYKDWLILPQYAVGNARTLLKKAETINKQYDGRFDSNIELLKSLLPEMPEFVDIYTQLGSNWVTNHYYKLFIKDLLKMYMAPVVKKIASDKYVIETIAPPQKVLNEFTYGTRRMHAINIIEHTMNGITVKVTDPKPADNKAGVIYVVNREETLLAQEKQRLILHEFDKWINDNPEAKERVQLLYAEKFSYINAKYDGSFLTLPGINPEVELYKHQRDAITRIILSKNVLLSHDVGSGKTYEFIVGVHELKRLNISAKNLIAVPNNVLTGAVKAHRFLYPDDKILVIDPKDFNGENRLRYLDRIKNGKYTAIYMACSTFDLLTMTIDYRISKAKEEAWKLSNDVKNCTDKREKKILEKKHKKALEKLSKLRDEAAGIEQEENDKNGKKPVKLKRPKDRNLECFDKLGITGLVVDEAHNYKNITINTRLENIVGMHSQGSAKADSLLEKVHYIQENDGNVIFSTGTVITNSLSDLYVFQKYLQPKEMEALGIVKFADWVNSFCSTSTFFEIDVDSQNFRYMTRFNKYHNLPELMALFSNVCDFYHIEESVIQLPNFDGYEDVVVAKNQYQNEQLKLLTERTDKLRTEVVDPHEDNILMVVQDGRKLALDTRLLVPEADLTGCATKESVCADRVYEVYNSNPKMAQVIFCDLSTPKSRSTVNKTNIPESDIHESGTYEDNDKKSYGNEFNVYDELKRLLIKKGIPEREIAFIHDGKNDTKRDKLIADLNSGAIRVMIGSTQKLGLGVNIQTNLVAVHHLDAPWKPSDITQREGRIIRQGNTNNTVYIFRYVTEGSFDSYVWQILENKRRFIGSFLSGTVSQFHRSEAEIDTVELDYAEVKALCIGNSLIKDRVSTANELEHYKIAQYERRKQLDELSKLLSRLPEKINNTKYRMKLVRLDIQHFTNFKTKVSNDDRTAFGEELIEALKDNVRKTERRLFDEYMGFDVYLPKGMSFEKPFVQLHQGEGGYYEIEIEKDTTPIGCTKKIDHVLSDLIPRYERLNDKLEDYNKQIDEARAEIALGNEYDELVFQTMLKLEEIDRKLQEA